MSIKRGRKGGERYLSQFISELTSPLAASAALIVVKAVAEEIKKKQKTVSSVNRHDAE